MENLTISDPPRGGTPHSGGQLGPAAGPPPGPPQLPPQMFTTAAQLLDLTDKKLVLVLRDGRKLIGVLRSWDQFANLVLTSATERYFVHRHSSSSSPSSTPSPSSSNDQQQEQRLFADITRGTYLVRGENVLLIGEIDLDKDDDAPPGYTEAPIADVFAVKKEEEAQRKAGDKVRSRRVGELWGGEMEGSGEVLF